MMRFLLILLVATLFIPANAQPKTTNLIPDASFEAPIPSWLNENGGSSYYLDKAKIADAPDGSHVLQLRAWNASGAKVLSKVLDVPAGSLTATVKVRAANATPGSKLALAIFDEKGKKELARFGEINLSDATQWKVLSGTATVPGGKVLFALLPSGPANNTVIQIDQLGLFAGTNAGAVTNNIDWNIVAAGTLANGKSWRKKEGETFLIGPYKQRKVADDVPVKADFQVKNPGPHALWMRFYYPGAINGYIGLSIELEQNGQTVGHRTIKFNDEAFRSPLARIHRYWTWVSVPADLEPGTATVRLTPPAGVADWRPGNIDLLLMTNLVNYQPAIADWQPQLYVRWTNTGSGDPYCLWGWVHRRSSPAYAMPGMLSKVGFDRSATVPKDKSKWIGPGESSPWSNLSPFLLPKGDFNLVSLTATRFRRTLSEGLVHGRIQGTLEFAWGPDKKIIRTLKIDQDAPRIHLEVPGDLSKPDAKIQTPWDFVQREKDVLPPRKPTEKPARYLNLTVSLALSRELDDPKLLEAEMQNLERLGSNGTYYVLDGTNIAEFYRSHGMPAKFGLSGKSLSHQYKDSLAQPDVARIDAIYEDIAKDNAAILPDVVRLKLADEPGGISYADLTKSPVAQQKFREYLKAQKVTPNDLGVPDWDQVVPVTEKEKNTKPVLFYYSAMFRLQITADYYKTLVTEKKKYFPDSVKTYVNYSPPRSWVSRGIDPFLMQRNGGLEMGTAEDWLGYYAGPEYSSDTYALLRAAGQGQPLGGLVVGVSGGALLQRIKYYVTIASGVRDVSLFNYGPAYASTGSWSEKYDLYQVFRDVQFELGHIDEAFHGTTRHPAKIAILYNRTAAIWEGSDYTAEQDARFIRWALTHAGYDADIIPEEDIAAGKLDQYKALYIDGIQLRRDAAQKIAGWVQNGGILFGGAGAATHDEFNRPMQVLESTFGAKSLNLKTVSAAGRPKYELRTQKILDTLQSVDSQHPVQFNQLCYSETLQPQAGAKVLFKDKAGAVMGTEHTVGKGIAIRLAALPGSAYINHAVRGEEYDPDTYLPQNYDAAQREFLSLPARLAKVEKVAQSNLDIPEIVRYDAPGRSVIFVINYAGKQKADFSMLVPDASWATKAYCADGAKVLLSKEANGMTKVSFPLNVAGAVVLEK